MASLPSAVPSLRDHLEDCIVFHELTLTGYELARSRVLDQQQHDQGLLANTESLMARENLQIARLRGLLGEMGDHA